MTTSKINAPGGEATENTHLEGQLAQESPLANQGPRWAAVARWAWGWGEGPEVGAMQTEQCEPRPGGRGHQERDWKELGGPGPTSGIEEDRKEEALGRATTKGLNIRLRVWESP